jgi:hypothetical protein
MKVIDSLLNIIEMYIYDINKRISLLFDKTRLNKLVDLFKYLNSQTPSPIQKKIINFLSVGIFHLLKSEKPPLCYGCVLENVNNIKSLPSPTFGYDLPSHAKYSWNQMLDAYECLLNSYHFKEIIVEDFEVENGMLGLSRDVYLSIVKFLNSLIVRKV